jgi:hypothetical protein
MLKASQIAFLTILVLVADVWGQSQRNPKRGREGSQAQSQPKKAQQAPTTDQHGTDQMPFAVKIIPTKESEEKAANDTKDREEKMELDRKLVQFNSDLAYYTKVLAWVAGLQFLALIVQGVVFALTLGATRKAANAADLNARAVIDTERPYIYISRIDPLLRDSDGETYPGIRVISIVELKVVIKNYGRTPAIFKQVSSQLRLSKDDPPMTLSIIPERFLIIERDGTHSFDVPMEYELNKETAKMLQTDKVSFWLHFSFIYRDIFDKPHETAGRWSYNIGPNSWNGEYEKAT